MSNTQNNQSKAAASQPKHPSTPDGKSKLPGTLPEFPVTDGGDPGTPPPSK
jgi:hypothetical protein